MNLLDDDFFAGIEDVGGVQLNPQQRWDLHMQVETYVLGLGFCKLMRGECVSYLREWLDKVIKGLDETIQILSLDHTIQIRGKAPGVKEKFPWVKVDVIWGAGLLRNDAAWRSLENEIERLKSLRDSFVEERKKLAQQGRKPAFHLHKLLRGLESTFRDAGGIVKGISRSDERGTRESPFIDFAWEVLLQVPESMRPKTHQALAVAWERFRQKPKP